MPQPTFPTDRLTIEPWDDPLVDRLGHDPRSAYVETYWLGILGPSACWLLRRLANGLDAHPTGFDLDLADTASSIGLRCNGGRHAPFMRTLGRLCQFRMARQSGPAVLQVRRHLPPLTLAQADRLPPALRDSHRTTMHESRIDLDARDLRRARRLALTLVDLGESRDATEHQLQAWRFGSEVSARATAWAWARNPSHPPSTPPSPTESSSPAGPSPIDQPIVGATA